MQKRILITGCSSGIGKASAEIFAANDWVVYAGVRKEKDILALESLNNKNIQPVLIDVTDIKSIETLVLTLDGDLGAHGLNALMNNAAISFSLPLEYASDEHIRQHFETNVFGMLTVTRHFLPYIKRAQGRIINISSGAGVISTPLMGIYSATKFSVEAISDALRPELRKTGVKVIIIEPGFINTEIHDKLAVSNDNLQTLLNAEAWNFYQTAIEKTSILSAKLRVNAPKAVIVAKVIFNAVSSKNPKARYTAGRDAKLMTILAPFLSAKLRDKMWQIICGL